MNCCMYNLWMESNNSEYQSYLLDWFPFWAWDKYANIGNFHFHFHFCWNSLVLLNVIEENTCNNLNFLMPIMLIADLSIREWVLKRLEMAEMDKWRWKFLDWLVYREMDSFYQLLECNYANVRLLKDIYFCKQWFTCKWLFANWFNKKKS